MFLNNLQGLQGLLNLNFMNAIFLVSIFLFASFIFMFLHMSFHNYKAINKSKDFSAKENLSYLTQS